MPQAMSSVQATKSKGRSAPLSLFCPLFHRAVELIGRRWTGAVIRALFRGPKGFNELLATIPGLSDRLLTERLRELQRERIVRRDVLTGPPVRVQYSLTQRGAELEPAIRAVARWAERWMPARTGG
jgi:DNA-binding HxlR family transcriptional regulator